MIVMVGASGDLTSRKLVPALCNLSVNMGLSDPFCIVGRARTIMSDEEFRNRQKAALNVFGKPSTSKLTDFVSRMYYANIDYENQRSFKDLAKVLISLDR